MNMIKQPEKKEINTLKPSIQEKQDDIFRMMSAQKKIALASHFFRFAKKLSNLNGARETLTKTRENF